MKTAKSRIKRGAFTLVESLLALALFASAAVVISQICYNCVYPLTIADKNSTADAAIDACVCAIQNVSDYDALDDGLEVYGLDGESYKVYGYAIPTDIIDLFELEVLIKGTGKEYRTKTLVIRPSWYEDTNLRDKMLEDRKDILEDRRKAAVRL